MAPNNAAIGMRRNLTVGGYTFPDPDNVVQLCARGAAATNVRANFRKMTGTAGYQVPVGKTFKVKAVKVTTPGNLSSAGFGRFTLGYSDNDVGQQTSSAFTNGVYMGGDAGMYISFQSAAGDGNGEFPVDWQIPAGKYPALLVDSGSDVVVFLYGYEE